MRTIQSDSNLRNANPKNVSLNSRFGLSSVTDMVGCFPMPRTQISPLKKPPQPPETVDTKFILITRSSLATNSSFMLKYGDNQKSLILANFDNTLPTKMIIHGFKGSGQDRGAQDIASAFLDLVTFISVFSLRNSSWLKFRSRINARFSSTFCRRMRILYWWTGRKVPPALHISLQPPILN